MLFLGMLESWPMATLRQQRFAELVAAGVDPETDQPLTTTDAYALAGYAVANMSRNAQRVEACRLLQNKAVSDLVDAERARIKASKDRIATRQEMLVISDSERVLTKLRSWLDGAECSSSQIRSAELLARINGLLTQSVEISSKERTAAEIENLLTAKLAAIESEIVDIEAESIEVDSEELKTSDAVH